MRYEIKKTYEVKINRKREFDDHCVYYTKGKGILTFTGIVSAMAQG